MSKRADMRDVYANYAQLSRMEREGVDFRVVVFRKSSSTIIIAPHGGGIEAGTSEVAREIAGDDLSYAAFEGTKKAGNARLHITSTNFDEPRCVEAIKASDYVVAIHGESSNGFVVFLGGSDNELGAGIREALIRKGFAVEAHGDPQLHGLNPSNICNRGARSVGVQLEISLGLRRSFFSSLTASGRAKPTADLATFAGAVREGLRHEGAL